MRESCQVEFLVSGIDFLGSGLKSQENYVKRLLEDCTSSIFILTYSLTDVTGVVELVKEVVVRKNVKVIIIADESAVNKRGRKLLMDLCQLNPISVNAYLYYHNNHLFHPKVIIIDEEHAIVGSANFTFSGYNKNHEIGIHVKGPPVLKLLHTIQDFIENCKYLKFFDF